MFQCVFINFVSAILFIIFVNLMTCQNWKDVAFINQNMYHQYCWQYANIIGTMCYFCLFIYFFYTDTHSLLYISWFLDKIKCKRADKFPRIQYSNGRWWEKMSMTATHERQKFMKKCTLPLSLLWLQWG